MYKLKGPILLVVVLVLFLSRIGCLYSGQEISLNFQKIEIRAALQILAEFTGINMVISDQVKGDVTLRLNNIPWEEALDTILETKSLEKRRTGNIMLILPARESRRGQPDTQARQVLIEARIVNVTKAAIRDLGIRFGISRPLGSSDEEKTTLSSAPLAERLYVDFGSPAVNPASVGMALARLGNGVLLDLELSALENENKAEIIASPKLMTLDRQMATIESGEEIPYQEASAGGATAVTFKKAVLRLKVTPEITSDNKLLMTLRINQDSPSARVVNGVPSILTREIYTRVLVNNGETVVLGGIHKKDKTRSVRRLPVLGRLPFAGVLFRSKHTEVRNEELLIFITPRIIQSLQGKMRIE